MVEQKTTETRELETDILVIGGGGTGLAAAISAAEAGAKVIVAEKCSTLGGTTGLSIGSITACCTSYQARQGIVDSHEALFEDIQKFNGESDQFNNKELTRLLIREGGQTIEWMKGFGFEFYGPNPEPPHRVPRMHNVIPNAVSYPLLLQRAALRKGVQILLGTPGRKLIREGERITGALLDDKKNNLPIRVKARKGVILACGDFSNSTVLKGRYLADHLAKAPGYNPDCQGEGHLMGMEVGARTVNMGVFERPNIRFVPAPKKLWNELLPAHPFLIKLYAAAGRILPRRIFMNLASHILTTRGAPDVGMYKGGAILVNKNGERFTNELEDPSHPVAKQPEGIVYLVFDSRLAEKFSAWPYFVSTAAGIAYAYVQDYERDVPDIITKGNTLEEAAKNHPMPGRVVQTVKRYNRFVETGKDEDFQRSPLGEGILKPPFYVMGPAVGYIGISIGGLDINTQFQVLDESGKVIPGLYAGGRNAGGLVVMGHGLNLAWAFTPGRLAGKIAAQSG